VASGHFVDTYSSSLERWVRVWDPLGASCPRACTPIGMDTDVTSATAPTMTLSELAVFLSVSNQALYDLRSKGRGPRGFRVGRELRFRKTEIDAWIASMEAADGQRHPPRSRT
jgi:excisionase family DNA binding protein